MSAEIEELVISKIRLRRNIGRGKYGTTMERTDLTELQWLQHAQEEAMDLAIYLEKLIQSEGILPTLQSEAIKTLVLQRNEAEDALRELGYEKYGVGWAITIAENEKGS